MEARGAALAEDGQQARPRVQSAARAIAIILSNRIEPQSWLFSRRSQYARDRVHPSREYTFPIVRFGFWRIQFKI